MTSLRRALLATVVLLATLVGAPTAAHAAALTNVAWSASNAHPGAGDARYSWNSTVAGSATLSKVEMTVPAGTAKTIGTHIDLQGRPATT